MHWHENSDLRTGRLWLGTLVVANTPSVAWANVAVRPDTAQLLAAVCVGALIVLVADHAGAYAFADLNLPVGVVTGAFGAPFLLWLLARGHTSRRPA